MPYSNLIGEMAKRRITIEEISKALKVHRNSVRNKLYESRFFVDEALLIQEKFFKDLDFKWLYEKNSHSVGKHGTAMKTI